MLTTNYFLQLTPTTLGRIRNRCRLTERRCLPISLNFLVECGADPERIKPLADMVAGDRVNEMMLVNSVILNLFERQYLRSRAGLTAWMRRKGGCPKELWDAGLELAREIIEEDGCDPVERSRSLILLEQARNDRHSVKACVNL